MNVLELFSGIGGMHLALKASQVEGTVQAAIDINQVANDVYKHNFGGTLLLNRNVQFLTAEFVAKGFNTIFMSPPCQPFTRNGLQNDVEDDRTDAFKFILNLLPELTNIRRILVENVKGFETSRMRQLFVDTLKRCDFQFQEFILTPTQFGVPNTRHRYYCVAKKGPFSFEIGDLKTALPTFDIGGPISRKIKDFIETDADFGDFLLKDKILSKYLYLLDICHPNSTNSCCFTKAYSRFLEGTGSVFTPLAKEEFDTIIREMEQIADKTSEEYLVKARSLQLRFFTPSEVCRLMCFPETFQFPKEISNRQKFMVLGNSINVRVVAELIKLLN